MNEQSKVKPVDEGVAVKKPKRAPKARRWGLMLALPLIVAAAGLYFYMTGGKTVSTDNAYVKQDIVSVSTQVNGPVSEVFVRENQRVKFGQPLYRVDPAPTEVALMQAQAQLSAAELQTQRCASRRAAPAPTSAGRRPTWRSTAARSTARRR